MISETKGTETHEANPERETIQDLLSVLVLRSTTATPFETFDFDKTEVQLEIRISYLWVAMHRCRSLVMKQLRETQA